MAYDYFDTTAKLAQERGQGIERGMSTLGNYAMSLFGEQQKQKQRQENFGFDKQLSEQKFEQEKALKAIPQAEKELAPEEKSLKAAETELKKAQAEQTRTATENLKKGAGFKWWNLRTNKETTPDDPEAQLMKFEPSKSGGKYTILDKEKMEHRSEHQKTLLLQRGQYLKEYTDLLKNPWTAFVNRDKISELKSKMSEIDGQMSAYKQMSKPSNSGHYVGETAMYNGKPVIRAEDGTWVPQ